MAQQIANSLAEQIYARVKGEIFDFQLLPGTRFTETELAERYGVSRTPVRDALYRLKREGFLEVAFRSGWNVLPFDFVRLDELYSLRTLLEVAAVEHLCQASGKLDAIEQLRGIWCRPAAKRESDARLVAELDEQFHQRLVEAAGNRELARVHAEITEKIRVVRRLDFLVEKRVDATYEEHGKLLRLILGRKTTEAAILVRSHITQSQKEVRKITLHMLHEAREVLTRRDPKRAAG